MRDVLGGIGTFVGREFDKIALVAILFATMFRAENSPALAKDIAIGAFSALLGFMQGRKSPPPTVPGA